MSHDTHDVMTGVAGRLGEGSADQTGGACEEYFHRWRKRLTRHFACNSGSKLPPHDPTMVVAALEREHVLLRNCRSTGGGRAGEKKRGQRAEMRFVSDDGDGGSRHAKARRG